MRLRLAVLIVLAGLGCAQAQQTQGVTVPPPQPLPSPLPQGQAYYTCLMNCDTRAGACQGTCSISNTGSAAFATSTTGARPDPGALAQCYSGCTNQVLVCKQACRIR